MDGFFHACGLPNVCGTIDGSHILFSQKSNKWVIAIVCTNVVVKGLEIKPCLLGDVGYVS
jgi:hypothetical protein